MHWDKELTNKLVEEFDLSWEHARIAVGEVADHRQTADREGFIRGYDEGFKAGFEAAQKKQKELSGSMKTFIAERMVDCNDKE